ncbi:MAG TPA: efflux RND transporter periplasmic adaptor subunit, partial [Gammaproteobacteria bacterium]|nr:efflux RND transporter periplasmic adaptor subunit [Gammaproteobacteria bacterium]
MNTRTGILFASILASATAVSGCGSGEAHNAPAAPPAAQVTTAVVATRELNDWADFTGRLEAVENVAVRPRVGGYVESVQLAEGARVAQGDLLFQIDPRPFKAEVERLSAERDRAAAELALARSYADRAERLLAQNATSREEYEQLAANASVAQAKLAAARAALDSAQLNLLFTRVTSPIAGRVSRAVVTAGNLVDSSTLLTTVVSDSPVYAYFDVDEQTYLDHLHGGPESHDVYVGLINEQGYPHRARLDFVDNQIDPSHGTIRARAVLDNADGAFTPGLFARMKLVSAKRFSAALVDDRAIGTDLGRKFVFVVDAQNVVSYRPVETGRSLEGLRVIKSGL